MTSSVKRWLYRIVIGVAILCLLFVGYILFMWYGLALVIESDKNYKTFCSQHISLIEKYYVDNGVYPATLNKLVRIGLNTKYLDKDCGYHMGLKGYSFYISQGLGASGYDFLKKEWWND